MFVALFHLILSLSSFVCSVSSVCRCEDTVGNGYRDSNKSAEVVETSSPLILYDLFASANHTGTLHQGHYVANVKVDNQWYHCNDQHVSKCEDEEEVLRSEAYMLFYIRS